MTEFIANINKKGYKVKDGLMDRINKYPYQANIGDNNSMRTTFKTEKDRIRNSLIDNSIYESAPSPDPNKSFELRPRQPEKEIGDAKIRYQPRLLIERVMDTVNKNSSLFVDDNLRSSSISPLRNSIGRNKNDYSSTHFGSDKKLRK
jgi:hypothetical protein